MALPNIYTRETSDVIISRIHQLHVNTPAKWGKMNVAQMLAHCNVTYEMVYENKHPKPNAFLRFILKAMVKPIVVNEKPYARNSRTAPAFLIVDEREFEKEKKRLVEYIAKTQHLGSSYFEDRESLSFGKLSAAEWNNMFYKHLDHHLSQFGV